MPKAAPLEQDSTFSRRRSTATAGTPRPSRLDASSCRPHPSLVELKLTVDEFVVLRPTYWCVGLLGFSLSPEPDTPDSEVLTALIKHTRYRDHYSSPESWSSTTEPIHGPYDLTLLDASHFRPLPNGEVEAEMRALLDDAEHYGALAETLTKARAMGELLLDGGGRVYDLSRRDDIPLHSWGWVLGSDWHEIVRVDAAAGRVFDLLWFVD